MASVQQGENLYCGFGDGCMTKTIAEHMEIGQYFPILFSSWSRKLNWLDGDFEYATFYQMDHLLSFDRDV